jgi:hypothetical protein
MINEAFVSEGKLYLLYFTSPLGVTLGAVELAPRLRTRVSHRTALLFRNVSTLQNSFFNRCFDLIYTLFLLHYFLYFGQTLKAISLLFFILLCYGQKTFVPF